MHILSQLPIQIALWIFELSYCLVVYLGMSWYVITNLYMMEIKFFKTFCKSTFVHIFSHLISVFHILPEGVLKFLKYNCQIFAVVMRRKSGLIHKSDKILFCYYSLIIKKCGNSQSRRLGKIKVITNWDNLFMGIIWMKLHFHKFIRKFPSNYKMMADWVKFHL